MNQIFILSEKDYNVLISAGALFFKDNTHLVNTLQGFLYYDTINKPIYVTIEIKK